MKSFQAQYTFFPVPWWTPFTLWISPHWSHSLPVSHTSLVSFWIACSTSITSNTGEIMYIQVIHGSYFQKKTQTENIHVPVINKARHWQWLRYLFTKIRKFHVSFVNFNLSKFVYIYFEWMILNLNWVPNVKHAYKFWFSRNIECFLTVFNKLSFVSLASWPCLWGIFVWWRDKSFPPFIHNTKLSGETTAAKQPEVVNINCWVPKELWTVCVTLRIWWGIQKIFWIFFENHLQQM